MKSFHICLFLTLVLATGACVAQVNPDSPKGDVLEPVIDLQPGDSEPIIRDPWEGMNRKVHAFNNAADRYVLRPLARGYDRVTPTPVQVGISRFFANLALPLTAVNQVLQGRPSDAARSAVRFTTNSTVGIGGLFDPATRLGMPHSGDEDTGQTFATWGWRESRYLVLPLLGPRTVRDAVAIFGDQPLSPLSTIQNSGTSAALQTLEIVDMRAGLLPLDELRSNALDDYALVRDVWSQRRNKKIDGELDNEQN